ncbi:coiled-coil domain-containing protein 37-like [Pitangus sulphuratus]|nr:coiled-coil domain-containing protein 37-like [Pitangus sulphuratus]
MSVLSDNPSASLQEIHSAETITDIKGSVVKIQKAPRPTTPVKLNTSVTGISQLIDSFMVFFGPGSRPPSQHTASTSKSLSSSPAVETHLILSESSEEDEENPMKNPFTIPSDADILVLRDKEIKKAKAYAMAVKRDEIKKMEDIVKNEEKKLEKAEKRMEKDAAMFEEFLQENQNNSVQALKIVIVLVALSPHTFNKREEREQQPGNTLIAKALDLVAARNLLLALPLPFVSRYPYQGEMPLPNPSKQEQSPQGSKLSTLAHYRAKEETSAKRKKIMELQAITSQIKKVQGDISRIEDTLQEYKMYRDILYQLSPKEWQKEHGKKHTKDKDSKTESRTNEGSASSAPGAEQDQGLTARTAHTTSFTDMPRSLLHSESLDFRSRDSRPQLKHFLKPLLTRELSSLEDAENENSSDEDEEPELYFTHPEQLLITFMKMQDENISFIKNSHDIEERWNKIQHTFITTHESMEKELAELKQQVNTLQSSVTKEEERVADLKHRVHLFFSGEYETDGQDKMLASLNKKVLEVYSHCTGDNETNLKTIEMLKVIEKQLNDLLDSLERIPQSKIEKAQKAIQKEKRARLREEKLKQKQQQEEGLKRDMERLQATVEKKNGGKLAFHSNPPARKEKTTIPEQIDKEKEEQMYYFS